MERGRGQGKGGEGDGRGETEIENRQVKERNPRFNPELALQQETDMSPQEAFLGTPRGVNQEDGVTGSRGFVTLNLQERRTGLSEQRGLP